ncbi:MAG: hypothetical protein N3D85_01925 [Candidatus Bathyarchaeota archaeon]|nr:hypothetical protein [Candidatus Bathyarchaeota archaeon]
MNKSKVENKKSISLRFIILVVVCAYFTLAIYDLIQSAIFSNLLISHISLYEELMPLDWWRTLFYTSELGGSVGGILRFLASCLALYAAVTYWRKKDFAFSQIKRQVSWAILLEASYFISLIPSAVLGFVFPTTGGNVWYFGTTPVNEVLFVAGFACLAMILAVPPVLLKLRAIILQGASSPLIVKWSCISAVTYLFVVFWFNTTMQWVGMITTFGVEILLDPFNLAGFVPSVFGLLGIAIATLVFTSPMIKTPNAKLNQFRLGTTAVAFGCYYVFAILVYFASGGYAARPWSWYEMIVPHNPYLWCVIFLFAGLPALARYTIKS